MLATSFGGTMVEGYVPYIDGLGGGDYVNLNVCIECGKLQNFGISMSDERLKEYLVEGE